jgi:uncharacterized protein YbaP (TraB family)
MSKVFKLAFAFALLALSPASARMHHVGKMHPSAEAKTTVHPAMWAVHGPKGTAYLFGSIHILPPNINWKTPEVLAAMNKADTFVFEIPLDHQDKDRAEAQRMQKDIMDVHGLLPPGQSLRGQVPQDSVAKYDAVLAKLSISPGYIDRLEPWLASMVMETAQFFRSDARAMNGVDVQVFAFANDKQKASRGFETLEQQLAIIGPEEQKAGAAELNHTLDEVLAGTGTKKYDELVAAWEHADIDAIARETDVEFAKDPALRKTILDDRTARWAEELKPMLESPNVYFITVGAAHLVGPTGLPALMRDAGYKVDGPIDKATPALRAAVR